MPCPECNENHQRARRAETIEQSMLAFTEMFSKLARQLWELEAEMDRRRYAADPPPPGAEPVRKRRLLLVPADLVGGKSELQASPEPMGRIGTDGEDNFRRATAK